MFKSIPGEAFLKWRKKMILIGGRKVDFDWLLDMVAGVSWAKLQSIILNPDKFISLDISTDELEVIWKSHLKDQTPLQYLISKCPWRDVELGVVGKNNVDASSKVGKMLADRAKKAEIGRAHV